MITLFQIVMGMLAVIVFFGDRLNTIFAPNSSTARLSHLKEDASNLVDIASHLEANGMPEEAKKCTDLIPILVTIHNRSLGPTVPDLTSGVRHA